MKDCKVSLNIETLDDVYNFRTKVYAIIHKLMDEEIHASRIASAVSSYLGKVLKAKQ